MLAPGTRLRHYEIVSPLGAGGMGEVYRARDPRLGRDVAIKVLPAERMADERRRLRFLREARAASALNHPNIVTIHEIDAVQGVDFIVMELIEGRSLDLLIRGPRLTLKDVLRVAIPVADALARAHAAGIIHRDLKPANIVIGASGEVKLLDFGLAKLVGPEESDASIGATAETITADAVSRPGTMAGTPGYMSPEQVSGGAVDARSDVFGFGAVLYEMVTGRQAFPGSSAAEKSAAVLKEQPGAASDVVPGVPKELERVIQRCLRKEPDRRYQHMLDVKVELLEIREESDASPASATRPNGQSIRRRPAAAIVVAVGALVALGSWLFRSRAAPPGPLRVDPLTATAGLEWDPTFSPDAQQVAFSWNGNESQQPDIYVKMVGSSESHRLTTDPAPEGQPAWSPDGRQIAFVRSLAEASAIYLVSPLGGTARKLSDLPLQGPLSWSPDATSLAAERAVSTSSDEDSAGIWLVPVAGGEPRRLVAGRPHADVRAPAFSPDGRNLAYASCASRLPPVPCEIYLAELGSRPLALGPSRRLTRRYPNIHRLAWAGDGRSIVFDTEPGPYTGYLWRVDVDGRREPQRLEVAGRGAWSPAVAPGGNRLAFAQNLYHFDVVRFGAESAREVVLDSAFYDGIGCYSPDGERLAFESMRSGNGMEIWLAGKDGKNPVQLTRGPGGWQGSPAWSPDGRRIAFDSQDQDGRWDIWTIDVEGGAPVRLTHDTGNENVPSWSRDGRFVYFSSDRDGASGIFRVPAAGGAEERLTRTGIAFGAQESSDGRTLFLQRPRAGPLVAHSLLTGRDESFVECVQGFPGFVVTPKRVYYVPCSKSGSASLHVLDLGSRRDRPLGKLDRFAGYLAVSPDERTILYLRLNRATGDLMLVENFR